MSKYICENGCSSHCNPSCNSSVAWVKVGYWGDHPSKYEYYCKEHAKQDEDFGYDTQSQKWITLKQHKENEKNKKEAEEALEVRRKHDRDVEIDIRDVLYSNMKKFGWIDCKVALPEIGVEVQITDGRSITAGYRNSVDDHDFMYMSKTGSSQCFIIPTYWCPFSELPEDIKRNNQ